MNLALLQNLTLWRLRARGVNFGGSPNGAASDQNPLSAITPLLNAGYGEFLERTREARLPGTVLQFAFPTVANARAYSLNPIPSVNPGAGINTPVPLEVVRVTYTPLGGAQYPVALVSTQEFERVTGGFVRRLSWFGPRMYYATRLDNALQLDVAPGTATAGDTITLWAIPDVNATGALAQNVPTCAQGGPMAVAADVPLIPQQYHPVLVDYVVSIAGDAADMGAKVKYAADRWEAAIAHALSQGATSDGGQATIALDRFEVAAARDA